MARPTFVCHLDITDLLQGIDLALQEHRQAAASAINKACAKQRTVTCRDIAQNTRIPYGIIRKRFRIRRATQRNLNGSLRIINGPILWKRLLQGEKTYQGPVAYLRSHKKRHTVTRAPGLVFYGGRSMPGAFIARGYGGSDQVFARKGTARLPLNAPRDEIKTLAEQALAAHANLAAEEVARIMPHEIEYFVERKRALFDYEVM